MRILVAHDAPRARVSGMSRLMGAIHDRLVGRGHDVDYFCSDDTPAAARTALGRLSFPWLAWHHARRAARNGVPYDIVNVHEPQALPLAAFRGSHHAAVVVTTHGLEQRAWEVLLQEAASGHGGPSWKTRAIHPALRLWQARRSLRLADHVICLSEQDREFLAARLAVPPARVTRVFPGAAEPFAQVALARDYTRPPALLFGGTWLARKGVGDLVDAFGRIHAAGVHPPLIVFGGGVPEETVKAAFPPDLRRFVRCTAASEDAAVASIFAEGDIFILPSVFEGTPLTLMEALTSGMPVVTTATSGMRDVVRHEHNGLLVDVHDPAALAGAVLRLMANPREREQLGRAAAAEAAVRYTWDAAAEAVASAYGLARAGKLKQ